MHNGLSHHHVNSLLKEGYILYVGTYNGLTIYNLRNRTSKKINASKGLAGNSILNLANDKDKLIIGTDKGVSFYSKKEGKISNFQIKFYKDHYYAVDKILVTEKAIYVIFLSFEFNIFRFDKKLLSWENIKLNSLNKKLEEFITFTSLKNYVYLLDSQNNLYRYEDKYQSRLEEVILNNKNYIIKEIKEKEGEIPFPHRTKKMLFTYDNNLYVVFYNNIYEYNFKNQKLRFAGSLFFNYSQKFNKLILKNNKIYFQLTDDSVWIRFYTLNKVEEGKIKLNQPVYFNKSILSIVDNLVFLCANNKIYQLNLETNLLKKWIDKECNIYPYSDYFSVFFIPVTGTKKIAYFFQTIDYPGIFEPNLSMINFLDKSIKKIDLPDWLIKELFNEDIFQNSWRILSFKKYLNKNKVIFSFFPLSENEPNSSPKEETEKKVEFDLVNEVWGNKMSIKEDKKSDNQINEYFCNEKFTFKNKFFKKTRCKINITNGKKWILKGPINYNENEKLRLIKKNPSGKDKIFYFPEKVSLIPYNTEAFPMYKYEGRQNGFSMYYYKTINLAKVNKDDIYIATNVGLYVFNTKNFSWKIITTDDGLVSNNVLNFAIDDENKIILAITEGGLSIVTLKN